MDTARSLGRGEELPVPCKRLGVALSWEVGPSSVDLDLQAVAFSRAGQLLDAVYYNNLKALGRGLTHSGDETTGERKGFDECIWVHVAKLPPEAQLILFVVACYRGGSIPEAKGAQVHVLEDVQTNVMARLGLERTAGRAAVVAGMQRRADGWSLRALDAASKQGQHFIDILEPTIGDIVRSIVPTAPKRIKAAFAMAKGSVVDLPAGDELRHITACLGWDTSMGEVDLDVSAILLDGDANEVDCCFFGNEETRGVRHSGDNLTGDGAGDDECIALDLQAIAPEVQQIFFVINIYSKNRTFSTVANPYCRIVTAQGEEFCRYQLREAGDEKALIMARLFKVPGDRRWGFQAVGSPCKGQTYKDSMPAVVKYARKRPQELSLARSGSTMSFASDAGAPCASNAAPMLTGKPPLAADGPLVEDAGKDSMCGQGCCLQ